MTLVTKPALMTDSDNIHPFPASRRGRSASVSRPTSPEVGTALLTACLALVRPAGMTDRDVEDWLRVAVQTVGEYPVHLLDRACLEARRTCTHYSQIVPAIVAHIEPILTQLTSIEQFAQPMLPPPRPLRLSDDEFAHIVAERGLALSSHLDRGMILSNGDGTFRLPDDAA